jgi:uncharacterized repeat protein (TIGR02543 family)
LTNAGHTFGGWYTEQNGAGTEFTPTTPVTGTITVYAKWMEELSEDPPEEDNANSNLPLTETVYFNTTENAKTTVDMNWDGYVDEGAAQAVKLSTGEELTAYFEVVKAAGQTVAVKPGKDAAKVTAHTESEAVDGSTPGDDLVVVEVDMEDLLFDGTDENGKATRTFDLVVSEDGKAPVTVTVNLELTLPTDATIYQRVDGKWTRIAAALTTTDITTKYGKNQTLSSKPRGGLTLTEGTVTDLQNALAYVNLYAVDGTGTGTEAGTTNGYNEYRIFIKKNEKIGNVHLNFNTKNYVSLELYGAGVPDSEAKDMERHITLNHAFNTANHVLTLDKMSTSTHGLITLFCASKYQTLVLGKNITLDGRQETAPGEFKEFQFDYDAVGNIAQTIGIQYLLSVNSVKTVIMKPHSKITGFYTRHGKSPVDVSGTTGTCFYMQGGEISGNTITGSYNTSNNVVGMIHLGNTDEVFVYTGGTITGNTNLNGGVAWNKVVKSNTIIKDFDE